MLAAVGLALAGCGATSGSSDGASSNASATDGSVAVPDVSGEDGAKAVSDVEDAGLTATLADANDDPGFDSSRDATGCDVTNQEPAPGETASNGDEVTVTVDCSRVDWENQEGPQWQAFNDAYGAGFDEGCQALFDQSPTGSLYDNGSEYTVVDCQNENPDDAMQGSDVPSDVPDDPEQAGSDLGRLDGCQALFQNGVGSLNYGSDSYTEADCPVGASTPPPPTRKGPRSHARSSRPPKPGKSAGQSCSGRESDGTPLVLKVTKGTIDCAGAIALLNEWLRRAPNEGAGSGGDMKLYGWECIGGTATQPTHVGSCEKTGHNSAAFTASVAGP
jgi:hypothetical protein